MATKQQIESFSETIGKLAQAEYTRRRKAGEKWVLPSVCVAMGAYESGWGTAFYYSKHNACFNIAYPGGKSTGYYIADGSAKYRAYDSLADCVDDFYALVCDGTRYTAACGQIDHFNALEAIRNGGYSQKWTTAGTNDRVASIKKYKLTRFDTYDETADPDNGTTATKTSTTKKRTAALIIAAAIGIIAIAATIALIHRHRKQSIIN